MGAWYTGVGRTMTTNSRQFTLHLQFGARGNARPQEYEDFLMAIPGLLKGMAYNTVDFEVLSYERTAQTNLRLNLVVFPLSVEDDIMEQARRLGIRDPHQTIASTAMMLWTRRLQRPTEENPLHAAWRTWCGLMGRNAAENEKAPIYLHCFGLTPLTISPEAELVSPRSEASDPAGSQSGSEPVNLTEVRWLPRRRYDGST